MDSLAEVQLPGLWGKMEFCRLGVGQADIASRCLTSLSVYLDHGNFCVYYKRFLHSSRAKSCSGTPSTTSASLLIPSSVFWMCSSSSGGGSGPWDSEVSVPSCSPFALPLWRLCWIWQCLQPVPAGILEGYASRQSSYNLPRGKFLPSAYLVHNRDIN